MFRLHLNMFIVVWGVLNQYKKRSWHKTDHQNVLGSPVRHIAVISGGGGRRLGLRHLEPEKKFFLQSSNSEYVFFFIKKKNQI